MQGKRHPAPKINFRGRRAGGIGVAGRHPRPSGDDRAGHQPDHRSISDLTPFDINAVPFNTTLGTRTGISVELIGSYTPASDIDVLGTVPATVTLTAHLFVFAALGR
jgi:hypothetical protein